MPMQLKLLIPKWLKLQIPKQIPKQNPRWITSHKSDDSIIEPATGTGKATAPAESATGTWKSTSPTGSPLAQVDEPLAQIDHPLALEPLALFSQQLLKSQRLPPEKPIIQGSALSMDQGMDQGLPKPA